MLRYAADRRTLAFVAAYYIALVVAWTLVPLWSWTTLPMLALLCCLSWFTAVITHNTVHCSVFHSKRLNKLFQIVLTLAYGHPVSAYVPGHNLSHHKYTQTERDVMRTTKMRFRWNLLNGIFFLPTVAGAILKNDGVFMKTMKQRRPRWYRQLKIETAVFVLVSVGLLLLDWKKFVLWFYVPHVWAAFGIITINYLQHDGCDEEHEYNHSRNFTGHLFGWFTFNNGFHGIHHMQPNLHWSLCREAHDRLVKPHIHPNLDQPSILRYIWQAFVWPGRRLRYDGTPVVLPPKTEDVSWIPEQLPGDVSLGAEASA